MGKKYEFTGEKKQHNGITLCRIRRLSDDCMIGGWIQHEGNLSHDGGCWVDGSAMVWGKAKVKGNAIVSGNAHVYENAMVGGNSIIHGDSKAYGRCLIKDDTRIYGAEVYDNAIVKDNATVQGGKIYGNAHICHRATILIGADISGGDISDSMVVNFPCSKTPFYLRSETDFVTISACGQYIYGADKHWLLDCVRSLRISKT